MLGLKCVFRVKSGGRFQVRLLALGWKQRRQHVDSFVIIDLHSEVNLILQLSFETLL